MRVVQASEIRPNANVTIGATVASPRLKTSAAHVQMIFPPLILYLFSSRSHFRHGWGVGRCMRGEAPLFCYMEILPHPHPPPPPPPPPKPLPVLEERHCGPNTVLILLLKGGGWWWWGGGLAGR